MGRETRGGADEETPRQAQESLNALLSVGNLSFIAEKSADLFVAQYFINPPDEIFGSEGLGNEMDIFLVRSEVRNQ
jgi:hypothetical protein